MIIFLKRFTSMTKEKPLADKGETCVFSKPLFFLSFHLKPL